MPLDRKEEYGSEGSVSPEIAGSASSKSEKSDSKKSKSNESDSLENDDQAKSAAKLLEGKNGVEESKKPDNDNESSAGKPPKEIEDAAKKASGEKPAELDEKAAKAEE